MDETLAALQDQLKDSSLALAFVLGAVLLLGFVAKAQPTWRTFALILLPVPVFALSLFWPWLTWITAFYTPLLMLTLLVDAFLLSVPARYISFNRALSRKLSIGQQNQVVLTVMNNSAAPIQGMVRDSVPVGLMTGRPSKGFTLAVQVEPFSYQTIAYDLRPNQRGRFRFEKVHGRYLSRLGLLWMTVQGGRPDDIIVTPDLRRVRQMRVMASRAQNAGELQKHSLGLEGTQFSGLRHYFAGDDIRKMAWQATAKLDMPVVRTFAHEVEQPILVLLDAGRKMDVVLQGACGKRLKKYDWALNAALAFMGVAIDRGDCVGAGVFSNRLMASAPLGSGRKHLSKVLEILGETAVQPVEPDYETVMLQAARSLKRRSLVVVFTDLIDPIASRNLLHSLKSFSVNHLLMVVTFSEPETLQVANSMPDNAYDAYRKGVALDLLEIRWQTLQALTKANNAIVIDAPPDSLDEALIQRYLQIKRRSQL